MGSNTSLGLTNGTLYDVLDTTAGVGNVTVNATGFDITCRYLTEVEITREEAESNQFVWRVELDGIFQYGIPPTRNVIDYH
jgi:hypothetical protein